MDPLWLLVLLCPIGMGVMMWFMMKMMQGHQSHSKDSQAELPAQRQEQSENLNAPA